MRNFDTCTKCGETKPGKVDNRYSFGIYAGRLCEKCCRSFRDHCGIDQPQGDVRSLHEFEAGGWEAIEGDQWDLLEQWP